MITYPRALPAGDSGWTIEFGDAIEPALNARTIAFARAVEALRFPGVSDIVPTYRSATIYFDPLAVDPLPFRQRLLSLAETTTGTTAGAMRTVIIPVLYGWTEGPDLEELAASAQLSIPEVIARREVLELATALAVTTKVERQAGRADPRRRRLCALDVAGLVAPQSVLRVLPNRDSTFRRDRSASRDHRRAFILKTVQAAGD